MLSYLYVYLSTFFQDEEGQGMAEYGLILALVAVVCIAGFHSPGDQRQRSDSGISLAGG